MGWTAPFMCLSLVRAHVPGFGCKPDRDWDLAGDIHFYEPVSMNS